jgi:hypothetical protein
MTIEWIIALCVTAVVAVIGWTVTATLSQRMKVFETIQRDLIRMEAQTQAVCTRTSVLETKYDTVMAALARIEVMLQRHMEKT